MDLPVPIEKFDPSKYEDSDIEESEDEQSEDEQNEDESEVAAPAPKKQKKWIINRSNHLIETFCRWNVLNKIWEISEFFSNHLFNLI